VFILFSRRRPNKEPETNQLSIKLDNQEMKTKQNSQIPGPNSGREAQMECSHRRESDDNGSHYGNDKKMHASHLGSEPKPAKRTVQPTHSTSSSLLLLSVGLCDRQENNSQQTAQNTAVVDEIHMPGLQDIVNGISSSYLGQQDAPS
jgi:hypothetical protein